MICYLMNVESRCIDFSCDSFLFSFNYLFLDYCLSHKKEGLSRDKYTMVAPDRFSLFKTDMTHSHCSVGSPATRMFIWNFVLFLSLTGVGYGVDWVRRW